MEIQTTEKLKMQLETKPELYLFLFISRLLNLNIPSERVVISLSYDLESALASAQKATEQGMNIVYHDQKIAVKDLLSKIDYPPTVILENIPKPEMSKEQFINNLKLVADEFLTEEKDKKVVQRILRKINE